MAKISVKAGTTSLIVNVFIMDSASTTGAGKTGLAYNTSSLTAYYCLPGAAAAAITLATQTVTGAYSSGGFVEIDSTNMPGWYRFDIPNAAIASGRFSSIHFKGASGMAPLPLEIELTAVDNQSATAFITSVATVTTVTNQLTGAQIATAVWTDTTAGDFTTALSIGKSVMNGVALGTGLTIARCTLTDTLTTYTGNTPQTGDTYALANGSSGFVAIYGKVDTEVASIITLLGTPAGASLAADVAAIKAETAGIITDTAEIGVAGAGLTNINLPNQTMDIVGNITGNLSGSVGSVTGAVGSVTGNVGGNVVGSVGSLTGHTNQTGDTYARMTKSIVTGSITGGASTVTSLNTTGLSPAAAVTDQFKGRVIIFDSDTTTANLRGQASDITASTSGGVLTVTALTTAPAAGDTFKIY